jgi:hypothetical protein
LATIDNEDVWRLIGWHLAAHPHALLRLLASHPFFRRMVDQTPGWWEQYFRLLFLKHPKLATTNAHHHRRMLIAMVGARCQVCGTPHGHRLLHPFALRLCKGCLSRGIISNEVLELEYGIRPCTELMEHLLAQGGFVLPLRALRSSARQTLLFLLLSTAAPRSHILYHSEELQRLLLRKKRQRGGRVAQHAYEHLILFFLPPEQLRRLTTTMAYQQQHQRKRAAARLTACCRRLVDSHLFAIGHPITTTTNNSSKVVIMLVHSPPHFAVVAPHIARILFVLRRHHNNNHPSSSLPWPHFFMKASSVPPPNPHWIPGSPCWAVMLPPPTNTKDQQRFDQLLEIATQRVTAHGSWLAFKSTRAWLPP